EKRRRSPHGATLVPDNQDSAIVAERAEQALEERRRIGRAPQVPHVDGVDPVEFPQQLLSSQLGLESETNAPANRGARPGGNGSHVALRIASDRLSKGHVEVLDLEIARRRPVSQLAGTSEAGFTRTGSGASEAGSACIAVVLHRSLQALAKPRLDREAEEPPGPVDARLGVPDIPGPRRKHFRVGGLPGERGELVQE